MDIPFCLYILDTARKYVSSGSVRLLKCVNSFYVFLQFQIPAFIDLPAQTDNSFSEGETLKRAFNARLDIPKEGFAWHALPSPADIGQHLNGTFKLNYHHITFYRQPYPGTFLPLNGLFLMHFWWDLCPALIQLLMFHMAASDGWFLNALLYEKCAWDMLGIAYRNKYHHQKACKTYLLYDAIHIFTKSFEIFVSVVLGFGIPLTLSNIYRQKCLSH